MNCYDIDKEHIVTIPNEEEEKKKYTSYRRGKYTIVVKNQNHIENDSIIGNNIVFTGRGPFSRTKLMELGRRCGCQISSNNITSSTNILVVGEKPGSKLKKAEIYGIRILPMDNYIYQVNSILGQNNL